MPLKYVFKDEDFERAEPDINAIDEKRGMDAAVYKQLYLMFAPKFQEMIDKAEDPEVKAKCMDALTEAQKGWKRMSYVIAKGVIEHLRDNMEVQGIETQGDIEVTVEGLKGSQRAVRFSQAPGNKGHVC